MEGDRRGWFCQGQCCKFVLLTCIVYSVECSHVLLSCETLRKNSDGNFMVCAG